MTIKDLLDRRIITKGMYDWLISKLTKTVNKPQPQPVKNDNLAVWELVIRDMEERDRIGTLKYGTPLQPFNGRNALMDAYQEVLDLAVYLRQTIYEQTGE